MEESVKDNLANVKSYDWFSNKKKKNILLKIINYHPIIMNKIIKVFIRFLKLLLRKQDKAIIIIFYEKKKNYFYFLFINYEFYSFYNLYYKKY